MITSEYSNIHFVVNNVEKITANGGCNIEFDKGTESPRG